MLKFFWKIYLTILLLFITGYTHAMSKNDTKFDWLATESAPEHYPMEIIQGTFYYHGEAEGLPLPYGGTLDAGWGRGISNHHVGDEFKLLPDRLSIVFFSYTESQFYKGEFDLPYEKILAIFRDGVANPITFPNGDTLPTYGSMMVGIAPGGAVSVWVAGKKQVEVFFGQAEKIELDPGRAFRIPFKDKQDVDNYIKEGLDEALTEEELESLNKNGVPFGVWGRYRNRYDWQPTASKGNSLEQLDVFYLNGDFLGKWDFSKTNESTDQRPLPSKMIFRSLDNTLFEIIFDEFETMSAFEKLGANGNKVYLEFEPHLPRTQIKIRLYNEKESIELKKFVSEDW